MTLELGEDLPEPGPAAPCLRVGLADGPVEQALGAIAEGVGGGQGIDQQRDVGPGLQAWWGDEGVEGEGSKGGARSEELNGIAMPRPSVAGGLLPVEEEVGDVPVLELVEQQEDDVGLAGPAPSEDAKALQELGGLQSEGGRDTWVADLSKVKRPLATCLGWGREQQP